MKALSVIMVLFLLAQPAESTPSGCFYGAGPLGDDENPAVRVGEEFTVIDLYVSNAFLALDRPYGVDATVAHEIIRHWTQSVHGAFGSRFAVRYAGTTAATNCTGQDGPVIIVVPRTPAGPGQSGFTTELNRGAENDLRCALFKVTDLYHITNDTSRARLFYSVLWHEFMHVLGYSHADEVTCWDGTNTTWLNEKTVNLISYSSGVDDHNSPTFADIKNVRRTYGVPELLVVRRLQGSGGWSSELELDNEGVGPVAAADGNTHAEGYVFNYYTGLGGWESKTRAAIYESGAWTEEAPSTLRSMHAPSIARSTGQATNKWLVGFLKGDDGDSTDKDLYFRERNFGSSTWAAGGAVSEDMVTSAQMAVAYDPFTNRFIVAYIDNDWNLLVRTRPFNSTTWSVAYEETDFGDIYAFSNGLDVACSSYDSTGSYDNCVVSVRVLGTDSLSGFVLTRTFLVNGSGAVVFGDPWDSGYISAPLTSTPVVSAQPAGSEPQFRMAYAQAGDAADTVRTFTKASNSIAWVAVTSLSANSAPWARPASIGAHVYSSTTYKQLAYSRLP